MSSLIVETAVIYFINYIPDKSDLIRPSMGTEFWSIIIATLVAAILAYFVYIQSKNPSDKLLLMPFSRSQFINPLQSIIVITLETITANQSSRQCKSIELSNPRIRHYMG